MSHAFGEEAILNRWNKIDGTEDSDQKGSITNKGV
jgi:hypothetical protein